MTDHLPTPVEESRPDLYCDCFGDDLSLWGPACSHFEDSDKGICLICGHASECHDNK